MARKKTSWDDAKSMMLKDIQKAKTVEERESMPDVACGKCGNWFQNSSGINGICNILKVGSDFNADPPVFVTDAKVSLCPAFNMEAGRCTYFKKMAVISKDLSQSADPMVSRHQRQMQK